MVKVASKVQRKIKLADVNDALEIIKDGMLLAIGGHLYFNKPCHLVRELAKRKPRHITLTASPMASYDVDLLVATGAVDRTQVGHVSFEYMGMAPNFRHAVEKGTIDAVICDESTIMGGYMATIEGIPYHPIVSIKGSDVLKMTTLAEEYVSYRGEKLIAVRACSPDVAIFHAQESDEYGNIRHLGVSFFDLVIAKASKKVIVSVDELVSNRKVRAAPEKTTIPGYLVDMVVHIPYGAHPCLSHSHYTHDEAHILDYIQRARKSLSGEDNEAFPDYLRRYVYEPESIYDYLERVGGLKRMVELRW